MSKKTSPSRMLNGCLLAHPEWFASVAEVFHEKDFAADPIDQTLWQTHATLHAQGKTCTPVDALGALTGVAGADQAVGALTKLMRLCEAETREGFDRRVDALVKTTVKSGTKRALSKMLTALDEGIECDWSARMEANAAAIRKRDRRKKNFTPLSLERFLETASNKRRKTIIPTGFATIDAMIEGWIVGHFHVLIARTNVGKSSMIAACAQNQFFADGAQHPDRVKAPDPYAARREPRHARHPSNPTVGERAPYVLILSVEDDVDDYLSRFVCNLCDVPADEFLRDPEQAVYASGKGEEFKHIAQVFTGDQRLTIADYEDEDDNEKTIDSIEKTILGWKAHVDSIFAERGEESPPLLVFLDYFQKIEIPEDESKATSEYLVFKKASARLNRLKKKANVAIVAAVMALRGPDDVEPDHNSARGGSDVTQDADVVMTMWPFGPSERTVIREMIDALAPDVSNVHGITPEIKVVKDAEDFDSVVAPDDGEFDDFDDPTSAAALPTEALNIHQLRRAEDELLIAGHKGRHVRAGWQVPLQFCRGYKRITDAYESSKIYRRDPNIQAALKERRKQSGTDKKR